MRVSQNKTGGGPPEKPLTDLEIKLISIMGEIAVYGMKIPELGCPDSNEAANSTGNFYYNQVFPICRNKIILFYL